VAWASGSVIVDRVTDVSDRPWSGVTRASYASAAEYCTACLIDENAPGHVTAKSRCKLPVYEPQSLGGRLNRNAMRAAANRLIRERGGVEAPPGQKRAAAGRLVHLYQEIGDAPPRALLALAGPSVGVAALRSRGAAERLL
jgi:hypothetical protein